MASLSSKTNSTTPKYTGMQLQSSAYGIPVPVIYGTTRVGWNLADYVNFKSFATPSSSGGKGGIIGGGGKGSSSTSYSASVLGIICEGPITGINSSWISQTQSAGTPGFDIFEGAIAQTAWSYLTTNYPAHALTYSGFCYAAAENYSLGTSANLPNVNWEAQAFLQNTAPGTYGGNGCAIGGDADASRVIPDMLSNTQYGIGFPTNRIGQVYSNDEANVVPGGHTITVANAAQFSYNLNCTILGGIGLLTCVAGTPGPGQYSFNGATGVYTFNAAQAGHTVNIRYVSVGAMADFQNFTLASGLWVSPAYSDQAQCSTLIDDLAKAMFSEVIWSSGVLQLKPRGTMSVSGNGYTYTPNTTPLFSLTIDDFMPNTGSAASVGNLTSSASAAVGSSDDPIILTRVRKSDQINSIKIEVLDRANQYATTIVESSDMALINTYGRRGGATKSLHLFADVASARVSAELQLQDQYILNMYNFTLDERFCILDPMDILEATDTDFPTLTNVGIRLLDLTENDDGTISVTAEEFPGTIGTVPEYNIDISTGYIQNFDVDPGDAAEPAMFDVPVQLAQVIGLESWLGTHSATGNPNWGGCDIYMSTDGNSYAKKGTIVGASRMGTLTSIFPSGSDPDTTHTLAVDLTESEGVLESGTTTDANNGTTICFVDGEYVSYSNATMTSTFKYSMGTYLRRGQWGSPISSHPIGALFVRLDDQVFTMPYNKTDVGRTIFIKLVSFNIFRGGEQDLSSVTAYTHTIGGPPTIYAPIGLSVTAAIKGLQLNWTNAPNVGIAAVEIWRSPNSSFGSAAHIDDAGSYATNYNDQAVSSNTQYWYWIRCRDIAGNVGGFDPTSGGAGATNITAQVGTNDIQNSAITAALIAPGTIPAILLAESLSPVQVVTSLGSASTYAGAVAFLIPDDKLYRWDGSAWTSYVDQNDLVADSVIAGTIAVGAVNAGAIIVNDIIVTGHLVANSVTASAASQAGSQTITNDTVGSSLVSISYTSDGGDISILVTDYFLRSSGHSPSVRYQLFVDGSPTTLFFNGGTTMPFNNLMTGGYLVTGLGAGSHLFDIWGACGFSGGDPSCTSEGAFLQVTELKR